MFRAVQGMGLNNDVVWRFYERPVFLWCGSATYTRASNSIFIHSPENTSALRVNKALGNRRKKHCNKFRFHKYARLSNPLTLVPIIFEFYFFISTISIQPLRHVKNNTPHQSTRFENISWPPFCQICTIFTHLKLWIAAARDNFKLDANSNWIILLLKG